MDRIRRILNIEANEQTPVLILTLYYFINTTVYVMGISAASSLFLARVPGSETFYPLLMTVNTVVTTVLITVFNRLARRLPLNRLVITTNLFLGAIFLLLEVAVQFTDLITALMFVMVVASGTMGTFQFYLVASTMFDARQSKRIFGLIGIGGAVAGIISGMLVKPFIDLLSALIGPQYGTEAIIVLVGVLLMLNTLVVRACAPYMKISESDAEEADGVPDKPRTQFDPYLITIMVIVGSFILAATVIDIQFQEVAKIAYEGNENGLTAFKGYYTAGSGALQLMLRLFVVSPVLVNFGILAGLLALPVVIGATSLAFLARPNLVTATLMKGGDQSLRFTINEAAAELTWVPIPPEQRLLAKPFVSGTFISIVQGITGIGVFTVKVLGVSAVRPLSLIVLAVVAVWIPAAIAIQRGYLRKLMESIKARRIVFEDLQVDTADSALVGVVDETLRNGTEVEKAFVLDIIKDVRLTPWAPALNAMFETSSTPIRERILAMASREPAIVPDDTLYQLIKTPNPLTDEAITAAADRGLSDFMPLVNALVTHEDAEVRAAAAGALLKLQQDGDGTAKGTLQSLLKSDNPQHGLYALDALNRLPPEAAGQVVDDALLRELLARPGYVRLGTLDLIGYVQRPLFADLIPLLGDRAVEPYVIEALATFADEQSRAALLRAYQADDTPVSVRAGIARALAQYLTPDVIPVLIDSLDHTNHLLYFEVVDTLLVAARQKALPPPVVKQLESHVFELAQDCYSLYMALGALQVDDDEPLLQEVIRVDIRETSAALLKLAVMDVPETDIESIIARLQAQDAQVLGNILEVLDNVLSRAERATIVPLFEGHTLDELAVVAKKHFSGIDKPLETELITYINYGDDWQGAVALDYIMRHPQLNVQLGAAASNITAASRSLIARQGSAGAADTLHKHPNREERLMYSILQKTLLLKNSTLFKEIDARELYHIAQITDVVKLAAGERLFEVGDPGTTLYVVISGQVRIHVDDHTIEILGEGAPIGEIAILDGRARTATATAHTDAELLAITEKEFHETIASRIVINRSIMRVLASRVRNLLETEAERQTAAADNLSTE